MWLRRPIWMLRYWLSSWAITFGLWIMPEPAYARDLRRRIYEFRDEASARILAARMIRESERLKQSSS